MLSTDYSVLMSLYNEEKPQYLEMSLQSMLGQTLKPEQIIIVLDGPITMELQNVLSRYTEKDTTLFTIINLQTNVGLGLALNEGIKASRNEIIVRMDTDDISIENRCEIQIKVLQENSNISILGGHVDEFVENPTSVYTTRKVPLNHEDITKYSRKRNPFNHPTVAYKKSEVLQVGGYKDYRRNQDLELFVRMIQHGLVTKNIDKSLVLFRAGKDNLKRRKSWNKSKSYIGLIYKFYKAGHSSFLDFIIVFLAQISFFVLPTYVVKSISENILRDKKNV